MLPSRSGIQPKQSTKQIILLMIIDGEKWHYIAVTRLPGLLRGLAGNNNGDFYCLNCFHAYRTKNKLET